MMSKQNIPITLYSYVTSPYAMKVHCFLLYKKVPFNIEYVNPVHASKELPFGRQIPVLKIDDEARNESSAIGLWLDEKFTKSPTLMPSDKAHAQEVKEVDQWITDTLIPSVFYSVYPELNSSCLHNISNTMRLGYCVSKTTRSGLPRGLRYFWPYFIRKAGFIRNMVTSARTNGSASQNRKAALDYLENKLEKRSYLAGTDYPTLADLSAWPQIVVPHRLGLKGFDDYLQYPNILRWVNSIDPLLGGSQELPPLVPDF